MFDSVSLPKSKDFTKEKRSSSDFLSKMAALVLKAEASGKAFDDDTEGKQRSQPDSSQD